MGQCVAKLEASGVEYVRALLISSRPCAIQEMSVADPGVASHLAL